jgi:hypothetical protein
MTQLCAVGLFDGVTDLHSERFRRLNSIGPHWLVLPPQHALDRWRHVRWTNERDGYGTLLVLVVKQLNQHAMAYRRSNSSCGFPLPSGLKM